MAYDTNQTDREKIDAILAECAKIESNLGIDSTKAEFNEAKRQQKALFFQIKEIDKDFYKIICP